MENLGAKFYFLSEKSDCRWICSRAVQFDLSGRESLISKAGVFHWISLWVPENHYSRLEILFLCFKFSFSPIFLFFFFLPSLSISEAEQPNLGNYWSLGDTEDFQMVFMFFGTVYIWPISFSRNSWIPPSFFFSLQLWKPGLLPWGKGEELRKARLGSRRWIYSDFIFISFSRVKFYTASPWPAGFNHSKRTLFIKCLFQAVSNPSAPALFSIVSRNISSPGGLWIALESGEVRIYLLLTVDLSRQRLQLRQEADTLCQLLPSTGCKMRE